MPGLTIRLFGKLQVARDGHELGGIDACKVQELLCYLLLHRDRSHPREMLASQLWGNSSTSQSKKYLRQALWQLQSMLDCQDQPLNLRPLKVEPDWVRINAQAELWLDVAVFEQASTLAQGTPGQAMSGDVAEALKSAVALYKGDLLEGWYQEWCLYERERLQNAFLAMLDRLLGYSEAHNDYETGLAYGEQVLRYDRARERTHRRLMRLRYLVGDRTGALRQYERCVVALNEELDVRPDRRTIALYQQIRADEADIIYHQAHHITTAANNSSEPTQSCSLLDVMNRLRGLQEFLAGLQLRIQQDIQAIQTTLNDRS